MLKIIKRNQEEQNFDVNKIKNAIQKANASVPVEDMASEREIKLICEKILNFAKKSSTILTVEDIQNQVEEELMRCGRFKLAQNYIKYRYKRELIRKKNTTDDKILSLLNETNEELKSENANKNPTLLSTQRDYMAGEVSKDLMRRLILPEKLAKAHDEGLIHIHDMDYIVQKMHNCCLINLEDMLQNGTCISKVKIEKPRSFYTACNVTTQIIAQVASSQFGGQSITLSHLAPFVDVSRQKIRREVEDELSGQIVSQESKDDIVRRRLKDEIKRGVQTLQYQIITLMTTNGLSKGIGRYKN